MFLRKQRAVLHAVRYTVLFFDGRNFDSPILYNYNIIRSQVQVIAALQCSRRACQVPALAHTRRRSRNWRWCSLLLLISRF